MTLYQYPESNHRADRRVAYYNPKFPWIEAVHVVRDATMISNSPRSRSIPTTFFAPARAAMDIYSRAGCNAYS